MTISLPLDRMTTVEKLQTMEALWEDLSKKSDEFISPSWHGEILSKRDKNLSEGKDLIQDWDEAKERIRRSIEWKLKSLNQLLKICSKDTASTSNKRKDLAAIF